MFELNLEARDRSQIGSEVFHVSFSKRQPKNDLGIVPLLGAFVTTYCLIIVTWIAEQPLLSFSHLLDC